MSRRRVPYWVWGWALAATVLIPYLLWTQWHTGRIPSGMYGGALATLAAAITVGALADTLAALARARRAAREDQAHGADS